MKDVHISSMNNFIQNKKLKENLSNLDFSNFKNILNEIILIDSYRHKINNKQENKTENTFKENWIDSPTKCLEEISNELRENVFNIKGKMLNVKTRLYTEELIEGLESLNNSDMIRFNLDLKIRDDLFEYNINLIRVREDVTHKINIANDSNVFITNLKFCLEESQGIIQMYFRNKINTKVYICSGNSYDTEIKKIPSVEILKEIYDIEKIRLIERYKSKRNSLRIHYLSNSNKSNYSINTEKKLLYHDISPIKLPYNILDVTNYNEATFIDIITNDNFTKFIHKLPDNFQDFSKFLICNVEKSILGLTSRPIKKNTGKFNFCGFVRNFKNTNCRGRVTFELVSLFNSNSIAVFISNSNIDIKDGFVIAILNTDVTLGKNLEFTIFDPLILNIKILAMLNEDILLKLNKFRYDRRRDFDCLVTLTKPVIVRNIQKYLFTITKIFRIEAEFNDRRGPEISDFPNMKLFAKINVDDGTIESNVYLYNYSVIKFFDLDKSALQEINNLVVTNKIVKLYDSGTTNMFRGKHIKEYLFKQFICYGVPFSCITGKKINLNSKNYEYFFDSLNENESNEYTKVSNSIFINGDIFINKKYKFITVLPFIKVKHIEMIENN